MFNKKHTLPRHTNLASQGLRVVAAIVDFAIALAMTLLFYFAGANLIVSASTVDLRNKIDNYKVESHLEVRKEDGSVAIISSDNPKDYEDALQGFYLRYLAGNPLEGEVAAPNSDKPLKVDGNEVLPKDYYTVRYYNESVLGITQENPEGEQSSSYWTFPKDEQGNFLRDELAIRRSERYDPDRGKVVELTDTDFLVAYQNVYISAYSNLVDQDFYKADSNTLYFYYTLGLVISIFLAGIITYIIIPFFIKNGQSVGKKVFKLGLATYDGYKMNNYQLLLRFVPALIIDLALLIPIWSTVFMVLIIPVATLLVSFALMMASPKRAALHDFAARTIVVDLESSKIFTNEIEEEAYIAKEDGLVPGDNDGEEPRISYEL